MDQFVRSQVISSDLKNTRFFHRVFRLKILAAINKIMASLRQLVPEQERTMWSSDKDDYNVLSDIGRGGCANVVLAKCLKNKQLCAIKQIKLSGSSTIDRSLREIRLMSRLKHPRIISLNAAFFCEEQIWIVEDFFLLGSLRDIMNRGTSQTGEFWTFDEKCIASILRDVLGALDYLHKAGYAHNDIKPGNIFLKRDGNAILADLGGAKRIEDKTPGMVTTEVFKAPEIYRRSINFSAKSDIWSTGITALVLYGEDSLIIMTAVERIRAVVEMKFQGLSQPFRQFLSASLDTDPNRRATISSLFGMDFFLQCGLDKQYIANFVAGTLT